MSSILSAQNLQTLRRRNMGRRWPSFLSPVFLSPPRPRPPPPPDRPCPNGMLNLRSVKSIVVVVAVHLRPAFAGLALRRQPALDAPALRLALALRARAVDDPLLFVDADDHVANHLVHHLETAIDFFHQLAGSVDDVEDVDALLVVADL